MATFPQCLSLCKARYIPCRPFSLSSVTLTLLSVVSKLPVDQTTSMPSARDQLSKLTGTTMTCICIGFMASSLGTAYRAILVVENSKFCGGASDYGWSMWIIVITQIITITIGALAIAFRWFAVAGHLELDFRVGIMILELQDLQIQFLFMKRRSIKTSILVLSKFLLKFVLSMLLFCIHVTVCAIPFIVFRFLFQKIGKLKCFMCKTTAKDIASLGSWKKEFEFERQDSLSQRVIIRCVSNINKWMNIKRDSSSSYMVQMLSRHRLSCTPSLFDKLLEVGKRRPDPYKVTCLSMVLLLKVGAATIPPVLSKSTRDTLHEAFEIVYYIDKKMNGGSVDLRRRQFAKLFWEGGDVDLSKRLGVKNANADPVRRVISNIECAFNVLPGILTGNELRVIRDFMKDRDYTSVEELCDYIEQLFSEMLQFFLA
ncbi:hypothetical protein Sjap_009443 [Stephania japonica]|uniref:Uncharacterized protein n=1 Tax=Stephania japonica TaxID=461633 RepID=A0AAP0PDB2_9MAGN